MALSALFQIALAGLMLGAIAACSSLGQQAPKSPEDSLQYAKATLSGVYKTVGDAPPRARSVPTRRQAMLARLTADESLVEAPALMATGTSVDTRPRSARSTSRSSCCSKCRRCSSLRAEAGGPRPPRRPRRPLRPADLAQPFGRNNMVALAAAATAAIVLNDAITVVEGLLNVLGATQKVSDIIAARIQSGAQGWTAEQRAAIQAELDSAKAYAQAQVAEAEAGGQ
jgi:hypothetical protein